MQEFETPMVREDGDVDIREIARRKSAEIAAKPAL